MTLSPSRPDWVILGYRQGDKYFLVASDNLTKAELEEKWEYEDDPWVLSHISNKRTGVTITLKAELKSYLVIMGESYLDCLTRLMSETDPNKWGISEDGIQLELPEQKSIAESPISLPAAPGDI